MSSETRPETVAIIEDDRVSRFALGRLLKAGGFETAMFENAEAFVAAPSHGAWLCVIVDVNLAGMSGIELQERLRDEGSAVPVIITTGDGEDAIRERAQQAGCAAFVRKPYSAETILPLLRSVIRRSRT